MLKREENIDRLYDTHGTNSQWMVRPQDYPSLFPLSIVGKVGEGSREMTVAEFQKPHRSAPTRVLFEPDDYDTYIFRCRIAKLMAVVNDATGERSLHLRDPYLPDGYLLKAPAITASVHSYNLHFDCNGIKVRALSHTYDDTVVKLRYKDSQEIHDIEIPVAEMSHLDDEPLPLVYSFTSGSTILWHTIPQALKRERFES